MDQPEIYPYRRSSSKGDHKEENWNIPQWPYRGRVLNWSRLWRCLLDYLPWAIVGFIMGRGILFDELLPFGIAYLAAVLALARGRWPVVLTTTAAGSFSVIHSVPLLANLLALTMLVIVHYTVSIVEEKRNIYLPALVFATLVITKTAVVAAAGPSYYHYMVILFEALVSCGLTYIALLALPAALKASRGEVLAIEEMMALAVVLGAALIGLDAIFLGSVSVRGIAGRVMVLLAGYLGGIGAGTALGTLVGLIPSLGHITAPLSVAAYASGGLLSGVFKGFGRLGVAMGFILANILLSVYLGPGEALLTVLTETAIAVGIFLFLPPKVWRPFLGSVPAKKESAGLRSEKKAMDVTGRKIREFARVFNELSRTFEQISTEAQGQDLNNWQSLLQEVADQACDGCSKYRLCWERDVSRTSKVIMDMFTWIDVNGKLSTTQLNEGVRKRCVRSRELVIILNCLYDTYKNYRYWNKKLAESRGLVSNQLKGVSSIMNSLASEIHGGEVGSFITGSVKTNIQVELGVAKAAKDGSYISGDSYSWVNLRDGKIAIILSDGMGFGPKAAMESGATVSLLEQLIETGFDKDLAVKTVNSVMVLRSDDDTFATVDLAVINLVTGEAEFIKIGSANSFIKRGNKVGIIRSASLPIGILQSVEADTVTYTLRPGDFLVMTTDGVLDGSRHINEEEWLVDLLGNYQGNSPQEAAELILNHARIRAGNRIPDDMTVMVAMIKETEMTVGVRSDDN